MSTPALQKPVNYFRIAWQSALAASICLGLPAGLLFWLIILQRLRPFQPVERFLAILQNGETPAIIGVLVGAFAWGVILSRISGYRPWWWLVAASMMGVYFGRRLFWVIYAWLNIDFTGLPVSLVLALHLSGLLLSVTFCIGLAHGLILRNRKSALTLASATSLVSVLAAFLTIVILDRFGIRVGTGNAAMPKVTAVSLMVAAIVGGMVLGVGFSRFVAAQANHHTNLADNAPAP